MRASERDRLPCDTTKVRVGAGAWWRTIPSDWEERSATCRGCRSRFQISAAEQKFWYEKLGIPLEVEINRCRACRRSARAQRRIISRLSELLPRVDADLATVPESRELVICVAEGSRHVLPGSDIRLLHRPAILQRAIAIAAALRRDHPLEADLLPIVAHLQRILGNHTAAQRADNELHLLVAGSPKLLKRARRVENWLASPTTRQRQLILDA